jgi:hypothetical protein
MKKQKYTDIKQVRLNANKAKNTKVPAKKSVKKDK